MKRITLFSSLMLPLIGLTLFFRVLVGGAQAKPQMIDVGGSIATDTTWIVANNPYILTDTVTVEAGVTLTIEAGVTVMTMDMGQYLDVQGHLQAMGTAVNPILFTSIDDLSANSWTGMAVSGSANFEYVTMRYASTALFISNDSGGDVILENSVMEENSVHPIVVNTDALHRLKMENVTFSNNMPNRVAIDTVGGNLTLAGSPTLGPQLGLEGYEEWNSNLPTVFSLPEGFTLTLQPGTNLMMLSTVQIAGHLDANGTETDPIVWQTVPGSSGGVFSVIVLPTGTAVINQTTLKGSPTLGVAVVGESDAPVVIENSTLEDIGDFPMIIEPTSLHRVQMNSVTFLNNAVNRVLVDTSSGLDAIVADVTLTAQPGLDWYEFADANSVPTPPAQFVVPTGVTMTVESGVELRFGDASGELVVNGRLQAIGTPTNPITFTSAADSAPGEWEGISLDGGSIHLVNSIVRHGEEGIIAGSLAADSTILIENSTLQGHSIAPLALQVDTLHQLALDNVTFLDNPAGNNIVIYDNGTLVDDVVLAAHPGLTGYLFSNGLPSTPQIIVPQDVSLTLQEGVTLQFSQSNHELVVEGELQAMGAATAPVVLTSQADSAPNQWAGIVVENGSIHLEQTEVRYGEYNVLVNNSTDSDTVFLKNSQLHDGQTVGLWLIDGTVTAVCTAFTNNGDAGILVWDTGNPTLEISSSSLSGNANAGLRNDNAVQIDARNNWWGDDSGPAGIGPGSGDVIVGAVLFSPWLTEETCTTVPYQLYLPIAIAP